MTQFLEQLNNLIFVFESLFTAANLRLVFCSNLHVSSEIVFYIDILLVCFHKLMSVVILLILFSHFYS